MLEVPPLDRPIRKPLRALPLRAPLGPRRKRAQGLAGDEQTLRQRFWRKLRTLALRLPFAEDLLAAYYCAFDRQTPAHVKAALVGAIAYFVLPADLIPDVLPVIGYTDDAAMLAAAIRLVAAHITPDHREAARRKLESLRETG
jgi:uncharacterized membrane protein YkvA (DUF1232 family)